MNSFAHRQPLWWYVPVLPLFVFPWLMTRTFWRRQPGRPMESGSAYCLTWALTALAGFSLVSGKQVYYPLPELPAVALWISRKLDLAGFAAPSANAPRKYALAPVAVIYALLGLFLCAAPLAGSLHLPPWTAEIKPLFGVLVVLSGLSIVVGVSPARRVPRLALATILVLLFTHTAIFSAARPTYDLSRAAFRIGLLQAAHHPVAYVGTYYDQFHFLGRLREPLEETGNPEQALAWAKEHPDGVVVTVCEKNGDLPESSLLHVQPYRGRRLAIWTSQAVVQHADIFLKLVR